MARAHQIRVSHYFVVVACALMASVVSVPEFHRRGRLVNPLSIVRCRISAPRMAHTAVSETTTTHLRQVIHSFEGVLHSFNHHSRRGLSIPMEPLMEACRVFSEILYQTGPRAVASNFADNLQKAEQLLAYKPSSSTTGALSCMKSLLQTERDKGIHHVSDEHATVQLALKDPSGAMGLLWIRRSLEFQSDWYEGILKGIDPRASAQRAYQKTLRPYHGWAMQKLYATFLSTKLPSQREAILAKFVGDEKEKLLSKEEEQVILDDLRLLVDLWKPLLDHWEQNFVELGLEDTRQV